MNLQELLTEAVEMPSIERSEALAVRLLSTGISLRETATALESFGVFRSHQAVFQWVHRIGEEAPDPPMAQPSRVGVDEYGRIDVLCNNAGILDDYAPVLDTPEDLWDRILSVNLKGVYLFTKGVLPVMLENDGGAVVNTASIAGKVAGGGGAAYTSSKHGVIGFTKQLSYDYGPEIRANAICPGFIETGMTEDLIDETLDEVSEIVESTPAGRYAQPGEVAKVAAFVASDDASFMHGAAIDVDGGWLVD